MGKEDIENLIISKYISGLSIRKISKSLSISTKTISNILKCHSIEIRPKKLNLLGDKFGRLKVIRIAEKLNYWVCLCDCGKQITTSTANLRSGDSKSCGCYQSEVVTSHGFCKGIISPEYKLYNAAKNRAKSKNLNFNIEPSDIIIPVFNEIRLKFNAKVARFDSPTLDRLIPELGYIKGNIRVISYRANTIKQNASVEELRRIADWLEQELTNRKL